MLQVPQNHPSPSIIADILRGKSAQKSLQTAPYESNLEIEAFGADNDCESGQEEGHLTEDQSPSEVYEHLMPNLDSCSLGFKAMFQSVLPSKRKDREGKY